MTVNFVNITVSNYSKTFYLLRRKKICKEMKRKHTTLFEECTMILKMKLELGSRSLNCFIS